MNQHFGSEQTCTSCHGLRHTCCLDSCCSRRSPSVVRCLSDFITNEPSITKRGDTTMSLEEENYKSIWLGINDNTLTWWSMCLFKDSRTISMSQIFHWNINIITVLLWQVLIKENIVVGFGRRHEVGRGGRQEELNSTPQLCVVCTHFGNIRMF